MKKIKIYSVISLDGYTARMDGDIDWTMEWVAQHRVAGGNDYGFTGFASSSATALLNLPYYYLIRSYDVCWPLAGMKCYVLSDGIPEMTTDKDMVLLPWEADGEQADEMVKQLLDNDQGDIWIVGDYNLIASFAELDLIDEIVLNILPITLGEGMRLNFGSKATAWKLTDTTSHDNGVVQLKYELCRE